jgi:putative salt-induced outer membrane protein YdiY
MTPRRVTMLRVLAAAAGLVGLATAAAAQQVLTLTSGDRFTGTLHRVTDKAWIFAYRGAELTVPVDSVRTLTAPQPIGVRLADGAVAAATVAPTPDSLALVLTLADGTRRTIPPAGLVAVGPPDNLRALVPVVIGWFRPLNRFWSGSGSAGFSDQRGNTRALGVALSIEMDRKSPRDRQHLGFGLSREQGTAAGGQLETTASKAFAVLQIDLTFSGRLFGTVLTRQERDRFQDLALRSTYTAGLGLQLVSTEAADLRVSATGGLRREDYYTAATTSVPILGAGAVYGGGVGPLHLAARFDWSSNAGDIADYRLGSTASVTARVFKGLGARVEARGEYSSRPLPGLRSYDMQTRLTLTYAFGR